MDTIPLKALGLEKRWPRLVELQNELAGLEKHARQAEAEAQALQSQLPAARDRDLDAEAQALRAGKDAPEATHEHEIQQRLERAKRDHAIYARAVQAAVSDVGAFRAKHRDELYRDVLASRQRIALEVAQAARTALAGYSRHEDLHYLVKALRPPTVAAVSEPARNTNVFLGFQSTQQQAPARGHVEQMLAYLVGLSTPTDEQQGAA